MRPADTIENSVRETSFKASPEVDKAIWDEISKAHRDSQEPGPAPGHASTLRVILRSNLMKLAATAAVVLVVLVLWRAFGVASKVYALSDVPGIIGQAKTVHVRQRQFLIEEELVWDCWYDAQNGREYVCRETLKDAPGQRTSKTAVETVWDGPFVMRVDHDKRTVRFERLLPSEQELHKLTIATVAMNTALPDVLRHLDQYTKAGRDRINGRSYDIWRREWRDDKTNLGIRYDIWVSPSSGEIGRTRDWRNYYDFKKGWTLFKETDKIEIDLEPPAGIFATEPPDGFVAENSKTTADIAGTGFRPYRAPEGYELRVLTSFVLEDGSVLACWNVASGPPQSDPNEGYRGLTYGGALPETPVLLYGLRSIPDIELKGYGSVSFWDEDAPITLVHCVGRHLMHTHKAGREYEWALYVPQEEISSHEPTRNIQAIVKRHKHDMDGSLTMLGTGLTSLVVTPERFAQYLSDAFGELSEDPIIPRCMAYPSLLELATRVRNDRDLYADFKNEVRKVP